LAAQQEINRFIKERPRDAAQIYLQMSNNRRQTVDELVELITDPKVDYTTVPVGVMAQAKFLLDTGRLKEIPASWKDYFFPQAHEWAGS
jgi:sulfonate transport system substrate-binding protein